MNISIPITSCRLCECQNIIEILTLAPTPAGDLYMLLERNPQDLPLFPLSLFQCQRCGHVQLGVLVDPEYVYSEYIYTTSTSLGLVEHFKSYVADTVHKLSLRPNDLIVEIGSNDGTLLKAFQGSGMRIVGVDPAPAIAQKANEAGILTINAFFNSEIASQIISRHGLAKLVVANNVLANVSSVKNVVLAVRELLAPDGIFVFETGYLRYLAEGCVFDNIHHEHVDYFAIKPLVVFFESLGMKLLDVCVSESKGSSIRCYVGLSSSPKSVSQNVFDLMDRETKCGYQTNIPYQSLGLHLQKVKADVHRVLKPAKNRGESIVGFGAAVGSTTILYHFELAGLIQALVDDNPRRHGLYSPGFGIPVKNTDILHLSNRPHWAVLLAWRYGKHIAEVHKDYAKLGGRFLEILPEVIF